MHVSKMIIISIIVGMFVVGGIWIIKNQDVQKSQVEIPPPYPLLDDDGNSILGVFEGRTPCDDCEKIKTALVLYHNPETQEPTTYWFGRVNVGKDNDLNVIKGTWIIRNGVIGYPDAIVYELDQNTSEDWRSYWKINESILLPLDEKMEPKVGDASWGYMLSRTHV